MNLEACRQDFPILQRTVHKKPLVYLDNAATSQKPQVVIDSLTHYYTNTNANIHRAVHTLGEEATIAYEQAHTTTARFLGASHMDEIVFTRNTTESLNLLAHTLPLTADDDIVITQMEHHSNLVPWIQAAERTGATLRYITLTQDGQLDPASIEKEITEQTAVVSLPHMSNVLGTINPVKAITKQAHAVGATVVVDGAQSAPHMPINLRELGCDFFACSSHKMYGPTGIGVLYGKRDLLQHLPPFLTGGDMIHEVSYTQATWNALPWKFEAGTPNIADGIAFAVALDYLKNKGMTSIHNHLRDLTQYALSQLTDIPHLQLLGPRERGPLVSFIVHGVHPHDLGTLLDHEGIAIRGGHHCAMPLHDVLGHAASSRMSFALYNTEEDVDRCVAALKKAITVFR